MPGLLLAALAAGTLCAMAADTTASSSSTTSTASPRAHTSHGTPLDRVVAVVNDGVVLESELDAQVAEVTQRLHAQNVALPATQGACANRCSSGWCSRKIQAQHADRAGIMVSDEQVNAALQDIATRNKVSFEQLPEKLASEGLVYADYRKNLRREIQRQMLRCRDVVQRINISPRELDQYMERQKKTGYAQPTNTTSRTS